MDAVVLARSNRAILVLELFALLIVGTLKKLDLKIAMMRIKLVGMDAPVHARLNLTGVVGPHFLQSVPLFVQMGLL